MPKPLKNLVRRAGRPGWYFRKMFAGRVTWIALGKDHEDACRKVRSLKTDGPPKPKVTVRGAALRWLECYIAVHRGLRSQKLARRRFEIYLDPFLGPLLLHKLTRDDMRA